MNEAADRGQSKSRILEILKTSGPTTAIILAGVLGLTEVAIRQHLKALEEKELVFPRKKDPEGRGRPSIEWSLTPLADGLFPDRHADLTVGLLDSIRATVGESGLQDILDDRASRQVADYSSKIPEKSPLRKKLDALAEQRTNEGYMAEVRSEGKGEFLFIEHHCPVCAAAEQCVGLCQSELEVFRATLGKDTKVERTSHIVSGDSRCVYRITKAKSIEV